MRVRRRNGIDAGGGNTVDREGDVVNGYVGGFINKDTAVESFSADCGNRCFQVVTGGADCGAGTQQQVLCAYVQD